MRRASMAIFVTALSALAPAPAFAQPAAPTATAARKAAAVQTANQGHTLFQAGKYREAIAEFQKADQQFHAPTFTLMIARSYDKLGLLLEARATYQKIVDEQLAEYAPQPFFDAQADAKKELEAVSRRVPTVQVLVTGAPTGQVQLTLDGKTVPVAQKLEQNPGEHTVAASAPGYDAQTHTAKLVEGAAETITIELAPVPAPGAGPAAPGPGAPLAASADAAPASANPYFWPGVATLAAGGVMLGIGAVTGAMSLGKVGGLKDACGNDMECSDTDGGDAYDSAETLGTVSTVTFLIGGAAAATGVVLLVVGGAQEPAQTGLIVGPGWVGMNGRF